MASYSQLCLVFLILDALMLMSICLLSVVHVLTLVTSVHFPYIRVAHHNLAYLYMYVLETLSTDDILHSHMMQMNKKQYKKHGRG